MIELIDAFLTVTGFCYFALVIFCILRKPAMRDMDITTQAAFYLLAGLFLTLYKHIEPIYLLLSALYAAATIGSFIGFPQRWMAHWKDRPHEGSDAGQIGMAFWDLTIAVSFLYLHSL